MQTVQYTLNTSYYFFNSMQNMHTVCNGKHLEQYNVVHLLFTSF